MGVARPATDKPESTAGSKQPMHKNARFAMCASPVAIVEHLPRCYAFRIGMPHGVAAGVRWTVLL
jgi:hypothetical protein